MDIKSVAKNISYLYIVRGVSLLSPLALIPHLLKTLGAQAFGELFFAQSFILYFGLLIDFGFELYAPGVIATHQGKEEISHFSSQIQFAKLMIVSAILPFGMATLWLLYSQMSVSLYCAWFLVIVSQALVPVWFFQGIGDLSKLALFQAISRVVSVGMTIYLVSSPADILVYPLVEGTCILFVSLMCWQTYYRLGYRIIRVKTSEVLSVWKEAFGLFLSKISISLYTISGTFILGIIAGPIAVSLYAAPMKIVETLGNLMGPVNQVVYPFISKHRGDRGAFLGIIKKYIALSFCLSLALSLTLFLLRNLIVEKYLHSSDPAMLNVFKVLAFVPLFVFMSNIFGIQLLLGHGLKKVFSRIITSSSIAGFVLILTMTHFYRESGTAIAVLIVEAFITIWMFFAVRRNILSGEMEVPVV